MTTQISELGRAQRRGRAVAPVSAGAAVTTVEPSRQIALTQQEACSRSAVARSFFVEDARPHTRVVAPAPQAAVHGE